VPIRDLVLFSTFAIVAPMIIVRPYVGVMVWTLLSLMNPHRLAFGPAYDFPFQLIVAILTLVALLFTRDERRLKGGPAGVVLIALVIWVSITTIFALTPAAAVPMWIREMKIFLMMIPMMLLLNGHKHIRWLLITIVVAIGYYGVKGGLYTIVTGGNGMVLGPNGTLLESNNHLAVANVMIIPLMAHFYQQSRHKWIRLGLMCAMLLCVAAVLGSYSRGAFLALGAMFFVLWVRSSHKFVTFLIVVCTALVLIPVMPDRWDTRMKTIETYEHDGSALSRLDAWQTAWNLATDRFLGGGFEYPNDEIRRDYSQANQAPVAHSIYFQALGEHGFVGLALFLLFWFLVLKQTGRIRRMTRNWPEMKWAYSMTSMIQASLVGFAVGGAFINIAFWDMPYYLYAIVALTWDVLQQAKRRDRHAATSNSQSSHSLVQVGPPGTTPVLARELRRAP